jgi:hypothetical protein
MCQGWVVSAMGFTGSLEDQSPRAKRAAAQLAPSRVPPLSGCLHGSHGVPSMPRYGSAISRSRSSTDPPVAGPAEHDQVVRVVAAAPADRQAVVHLDSTASEPNFIHPVNEVVGQRRARSPGLSTLRCSARRQVRQTQRKLSSSCEPPC